MAEKTEKVAYKPSNLKGKTGKERPPCPPITMASSLFNNYFRSAADTNVTLYTVLQ